MRLAPRFAAIFTLLVLTVTGCGGADVAYREVPGAPVELDVPGGDAAAGEATPTPTPDADEEETPDADADSTAEPQATTAPEQSSGGGTDQGTAEPQTGQEPDDTAPARETPDPATEDYCAANPGAC